MSDLIGDRIKKLIDTFADKKNTTFASIIGTSEANVRNYMSGTLPKSDILSKIVKCFDISSEWLLTGEGEMLRNKKVDNLPTITSDSVILLNRFEELVRENEILKRENEALKKLPAEPPPGKFIFYPKIEESSCIVAEPKVEFKTK